jgi:murein L,D-transpeptidase YafK
MKMPTFRATGGSITLILVRWTLERSSRKMRLGQHWWMIGLLPVIGSCQSAPAASEKSPGDAPASETLALPLALLFDSLHLDATTLRLQVDKSARRMHVFAGEHFLKSYACVLGEHPEGDKRMQGDRRTPEGSFTFRDKYPHTQWHKFIWIDYPNEESWQRFRERKASGEIIANADIGGEVGIHGVPEGMDHWISLGQDWTWGCIALKNKDIDEIYPFIVPGSTMIDIEP